MGIAFPFSILVRRQSLGRRQLSEPTKWWRPINFLQNAVALFGPCAGRFPPLVALPAIAANSSIGGARINYEFMHVFVVTEKHFQHFRLLRLRNEIENGKSVPAHASHLNQNLTYWLTPPWPFWHPPWLHAAAPARTAARLPRPILPGTESRARQ